MSFVRSLALRELEDRLRFGYWSYVPDLDQSAVRFLYTGQAWPAQTSNEAFQT